MCGESILLSAFSFAEHLNHSTNDITFDFYYYYPVFQYPDYHNLSPKRRKILSPSDSCIV